MEKQESCGYCSASISIKHAVPLWDDGFYCKSCVETICPSLLDYSQHHERLEEIIAQEAINQVSELHQRSFHVIAVLLGITTLAVWVLAVQVHAFFLPFAVWLTIGTILATLVFLLKRKEDKSCFPQTISVETGRLTVQTPAHEISFPLQTCRWSCGPTESEMDHPTMSKPPPIIIHTPEEDYVCGLTPDMWLLWTGFFRLAHIPNYVPEPIRRTLLFGLIGFVLGGLLGGAVGYGVGVLIRDLRASIILLGLLGAVDGFVLATLLEITIASGPARTNKTDPFVISISFFGIGFTVGQAWWDLPLSLFCGLCNGIFGWFFERILINREKHDAEKD